MMVIHITIYFFVILSLLYFFKNKNKDANNKQQDKYSIKAISLHQQTAFNGNRHICWVLSDQYATPVNICWQESPLVFTEHFESPFVG